MKNDRPRDNGVRLKAGLIFCQKHFVWLVMAIALVIYLLLIPTFQVGAWTDDGFYVSFARSLAQGRGMRLIHLPGAPIDAVVPPIYPLLLSPLALFFPSSFLPMQVLSVLFTLGTIYLLYYFYRDRLPFAITALAVVLFAFNPHIASGSIWVMSEAPFVFFMCLSLILLERFATRPDVSLLMFVLTVVATAAMILIRYMGLPLLIGAIGYVLYRRRDRYALIFVLFVIMTVISVTLFFGGEVAWERYGTVGYRLLSYVTQRSGEAATVEAARQGWGFWAGLGRNFAHLVTCALPMSVVPLFSGPRVEQLFASLGLSFMPTLLSLLITLLIIVGYGIRLRRGFTVAEVFTIMYCGFLLVITQGAWPDSGSAFRYIFPMIPFALLYFVQAFVSLSEIGSTWMKGRASSLVKTKLPVAIGMLLVLLYLGRNVQAIVNPVRNRIPDVSLGATWIAENTEIEAVVMAEVPRSHALYAQRTMVPFPHSSYEARIVYEDAECASVEGCLEASIEQYAVDYILISYAISSDLPFHHSSHVESYVLPFLRGHPEHFESVFTAENGMIEIFKVLHD